METEIINGITTKLFETFGEDFTIYTENIEQNLKLPCFFVELVASSRKQIVGKRYKSENVFDIHFFTSEEEDKKKGRNVASILLEALEYINLANGDLLRGTNMHFENVDDVLHFFVNYNVHLIQLDEKAESMGELNIKQI